MNTFNLTLDLNKSRASSPVRLRQGDKSGTTITALILDHGATANLTGMTAQLVMELPDGTQYYRKSASVSGNVVTVVVDESTAASVPGRTANAYIQMLQGTTVKASTGSFAVEILPDALEGHTVPESYDSAIQDAIDALDAAVEQMPDMVEDVLEQHPEWTTTVQDGSITKAKLATDLARDRERLLYRLANMLTNTLPEGDVATASDAAQTPVAGLALYGRSTQDGTPTPSTPVPIVSVAAANLYQQTRQAVGTTYTVFGLTFTYDSTNSATVSGTSTANAVAAWPDNVADDTLFVHVPAGTYTATSSHNVEVKKRVGTTMTTLVAYTTQRLATFTLAEDTDILVVPVLSGSGTDFTGTRVWACLFAGSTPSAYVPYGHAGLWARGRNLLGVKPVSGTMTGYYKEITPSSGDMYGSYELVAGQTYTVSMDVQSSVLPFKVSVGAGDLMYSRDIANVEYNASGRISITFTPNASSLSQGSFVMLRAPRFATSTTVTYSVTNIMLERGSTAHAYEPYTATVTPVPLDGHELRSLPDGTRDELTVDARGHAVLVQRVGTYTVTASSAYADGGAVGSTHRRINLTLTQADRSAPNVQSLCTYLPWAFDTSATNHFFISNAVSISAIVAASSAADALAALVGAEFVYPLMNPVTNDLGTIDPVPLCGPDLTAQAIPTAPMQLTYERDLNTTLARLEASIAELATN